MFWRFSYSASQLQTLLDKEDITLQEIIEEDDVLQECKSNNEKLIDFLIQEKNLQQLVTYIVSMPSEDLNENVRFKYATVSCELLTCDTPAVNDALIKNYELVDKMYSFLYNESPLNPLLASYFAKVIGSLISRKTEPFLNYIQSKEDFVELFLKHINTSAIMDILLRLLTTIDGVEMRSRVLEWLKSIKIIEKLVDLLSHENTNLMQSNASQLLCDIIRISREQLLSNSESLSINSLVINKPNDGNENPASQENKPEQTSLASNPLLEAIEAPERINRLLDLIFDSVGTQNCSVIYGIEVLLTIMDFRHLTFYDAYDNQNDEQIKAKRKLDFDTIALKGIKTVISCCTSKLEKISNYLSELEPKIKSLTLTNGNECKLLGKERLYLIKLLAKFFCFNSSEFTQEVIRLKIIERLVNLIVEYKSNNFLHSHITSIFRNIFSSEPLIGNEISENDSNVKKMLTNHVLNDCCILSKLIDIWKSYLEEKETMSEEKKKESTTGYMGHLILISNLIWESFKLETNRTFYEEIYKDEKVLEAWKELYDTKITELNTRNSKDLVRNPYAISTNEVEKETTDFQTSDQTSKKYMEFQREMKINCLDNFSLSEDHIISFNPKFPELFTKIQPGVTFQLDSNDENANLFEQVCSQRDNMCLSNEQSNLILDEEVWVTKEIKFAENNENTLEINKKKEHMMEISEDDDSLDNKPKETAARKAKNSEPAKDKYSLDINLNERIDISETTKSDPEDQMQQQQKQAVEAKDEDTFAFDENIQNDPFKVNSAASPTEEMDLFKKTEWADFGSFEKSEQSDAGQKMVTNDPWASQFAANSESNSAQPNDNWANFEN